MEVILVVGMLYDWWNKKYIWLYFTALLAYLFVHVAIYQVGNTTLWQFVATYLVKMLV